MSSNTRLRVAMMMGRKPTSYSVSLNGSNQSLSVNQTGIAIGTSAFTVEFFLLLNAYPSVDAAFVDTRSSNGATTTAFQFGVYSTGKLKFYDGTETNLNGSVPTGSYVHVALVRNGSNVVTPYIGGVATGTTVSCTRNLSDQYCWIGSVPGPVSPYVNASLSNLRICQSAVYSGNFTPPSSPLTTSSQGATNCILLTLQDSTFKDNSSNNFTVTTYGSPAMSVSSPF